MSRVDEALKRARVIEAGAADPEPEVAIQSEALPGDPGPELAPWDLDVRPTDAIRPRPSAPPCAAADTVVAAVSGHDDSPLGERVAPAFAERLMVGSGRPAAVEQYRKLAAWLHEDQIARDVKVLMVVSARPGEGKTLTAINLALTLSESYRRRVLLIDGDLRKPAIHEVLQVPNVSGLSDCLKAAEERKLQVRQLSEHLCLVTAGPPEQDPMSGLTSPRTAQLLEEARAKFDWVIIDTPALALLPDAKLLRRVIDAILLIVEAGRTPLSMVSHALEMIGRDRVVGVVLNRVPPDSIGHDYKRYYYSQRAQ